MKKQLHRPLHARKRRIAAIEPAIERREIYNIWRILTHPQLQVEAELRALCQNAYLGDETALCRVLGKYKMYVDTRDVGIASHLMLEGFWEYWVTAAMMRWIRRGATVMDIGANLGYFTILMNDLVGPEGQVHSFEPNPRMASMVRKSVSANGFSGQTTLHEKALGARKATLSLEIQDDMPGGAHIMKKGEAKSDLATHHVDVPVVRLDSIKEAHQADFFKIDVEGHEHALWRGMSGILKKKKSMHIFMEFTVQRYDNPEGFLKEILDAGFAINLVDPVAGLLPVSPIDIMIRPHNIDHMLFLAR